MPGIGQPEGATWGREDVIVFAAGGQLFRVSASGGEPEPLGKLAEGESARFWPQFLPDGRHYLYLSLAARPEDQGIYVGSLDSDLRQRIVASEYNAAYSPSGHLMFVKDETLMAQAFDATSLELSGEPFPVIEQVELSEGAQPPLARPIRSPPTACWPGARSIREPEQLTWFDRSGRKLGTLGEPARVLRPGAVARREEPGRLPDGPVTNMNNRRDIWTLDVARGTSRRLTFDPADDCGPAWSPDGSRIAFFSDRRGVREIYRKPANGSGDDELLLASKDEP